MSEREDELDRLLKPLAALQPSRQQVARWQMLAPAKTPVRTWQMQLIQVAAAACVGFIVGAWYINKNQSNQQVADNYDPTATIESVYSKTY
jgi:negative regulator of sigma E activity